ncbi:MAG: hypothetical protein IJO62_05870 [Clostridia bacterium]|nr:hypothetical protein [Clostridia bacterium]
MVKLVDKIPELSVISAEWVKIKCLYNAYPNYPNVMFWVQDETGVIAMTDGNMIIYNNGGDTEELAEFVNVINPACVFSDYGTLCAIGKNPKERINVVYRKADIEGEAKCDTLSSKEIYDLLDVDGLSLPEYPYFAVDYCHRLNNGFADFFAIKDKCCAVTFNCGDMAIMNGIASHQKGMGSVALKGVLQKNYGRDFLVCCRDSVFEFYKKNGFCHLNFGGYWVKDDASD